MVFDERLSYNQKLRIANHFNVELWIKREDSIHPIVSGNKYRKLKYNIAYAKQKHYKGLLTFGGAFSNHIAAVAEAGRVFGMQTIGVIRGGELHDSITSNPTLHYAKKCGMQFKFVSREVYKQRHTLEYIRQLEHEFPHFYLVPEGGTNTLGVKGCEEILTANDTVFDYICVAVGTGGTISGLINCSKPSQQVLGFPALKGDFLQEDISKFVTQKNWELITDFHFGGYAKVTSELIRFINTFKNDYNIALDPIYTGKMLFGIMKLIPSGYFPRYAKVLVIHTGGLQGVAGMNMRLRQKQMPLIV